MNDVIYLTCTGGFRNQRKDSVWILSAPSMHEISRLLATV